ncbi:MAG TPA: DUF3822 family protein [Saprospiraceae bacterium]|nr:DUF3822 family protein [Saprospiraceae bacterium]
MTNPTRQPELIITLSRDQVDIHLLANADKGWPEWQASSRIRGIFLAEDIAHLLDQAMAQNPALLEDFPCVHLIILDQPNLYMPAYLFSEGKMAKIASRHLRVRAGDTLVAEPAAEFGMICYSMPSATLDLLNEYYHAIERVHLVPLLCTSILSEMADQSREENMTFFAQVGKVLLVLSKEKDKLVFSKLFPIRDHADIEYFTLACDRLLHADKKCWVTLSDEGAAYQPASVLNVVMDQQLRLPSLPNLLAQHRPCAS